MNVFSFLGSVMSDSNGDPSTMRIVLLFGAFGIIGTWAFTCIKTGVLQPMDPSVVTVLGLLLGGKVVQKTQEKQKEGESK